MMPLRSVRYSTLPALASLHGLGHVEGDGARLGVRHEATRTEDAAQAADGAHHVRGGDGDVEVEDALLDLLGEIVGADDVGAGLLRLASLVALGEHGHAHVLAQAVRKDRGAAHDLVGVAHVDAQPEVDLERLVELGGVEGLDEADGLEGTVLAARLHCVAGRTVLAAVTGHALTSCGACGGPLGLPPTNQRSRR